MAEIRQHHVLVTGLPGTGKSTLCDLFRGHGLKAIDADEATFLKFGMSGEKLERGAPLSWFLRNPPRWDIEELRALLREQDEIYVFGIAPNVFSAARLFDKVIYLHGDRKLVAERLEKKRDNPFGTTNAQKKVTLMLAGVYNFAARVAARIASGFKILDASLTPEELLSRIMKEDSVSNAA